MGKSLLVSANREGRVVYEDKKAKLEFYVISLWLLFLLIIILTIDVPISFAEGSIFIGWYELFLRNIIPLFSLIFLVYGMVLCGKYKYKFKGTMELPVRLKII